MSTDLCKGCGADLRDALVLTVLTIKNGGTVFGGFVCDHCGRKSWRLSPLGPEVDELDWRAARIADEEATP